MNVNLLTQQLKDDARRIEALVSGVGEEQARWKPTPEGWSVLEVVNHLYDEEMLDFRVRLGILLSGSGEDWPRIDPTGWVVEKKYNQRDLAQSLANFLAEREKSLHWLGGLENPDWHARAMAPWGQPMRAGDMFAAWVAHDLHHIRQLAELHYAWVNRQADPYKTLYAGDW